MKKSVMWIALLFSISFSLGTVEAALCDLSVTMINQDPYPAVPGDYVKVVFQITGLENPTCKKADFGLLEEFPFSLDPGKESKREILGGTYIRDYTSSVLVPYQLRVDENALDGDNPLETVLMFERGDGTSVYQKNKFNVSVQGIDIDFEVSVKDFDAATDTLTFEILNTGENDVVALTVEVPKQENITVKGPNRDVIGDLDANDDTTFKYEASPKDGAIELKILYTDPINERRTITKTVVYDSSYFTDRKANAAQARSVYFYLFWLLILVWIVLWIRKRWKKKKMREHEKDRSKR